MVVAVRAGYILRQKRNLEEGDQKDFGLIITGTLTLFSLILGFTFSMAIGRYDQRKAVEEVEANAIGTEYRRAELLPAPAAYKMKQLFRAYVGQRIAFYELDDATRLRLVDRDVEELQDELWEIVNDAARSQPSAVSALVMGGMNNVFDAEGFVQAAWLNRIPRAAWVLLVIIAVVANLLIGYGSRGNKARSLVTFVLPCVVATSMFLIADIDSPRRGLVRPEPKNLLRLAASLHAE